MPGVLDALKAAFPEASKGIGAEEQAFVGPGEPASVAEPAGSDTGNVDLYSSRIAAIKSQVTRHAVHGVHISCSCAATPSTCCSLSLQHLATLQDTEQQQQYLRAQYQEAAEAEETALRQADAGNTMSPLGLHTPASPAIRNYSLTVSPVCRLHPWLEESWPACQSFLAVF